MNSNNLKDGLHPLLHFNERNGFLNMIRSIFSLLIICVFTLSASSCAIKKNIEDITDNANQILEELADLSRTVNSAVETGELEESVGRVVDDRIDKLSSEINDIIQEGGGFVFDEVNGTLDNSFDNIRSVIDDIKTGILDDSLPRNIELISQQFVLNTNNIAARAEDLINLTFGNTSIVLSQATDAAFTLSVWVIFGVGMLMFILALIIWGSKMNKNIRNTVFVLVIMFIGVCLSILFVTPVKVKVLQTLNVGEELVARALEPKIISVLPLEFELGTNKQLMLFGTHLDSLRRDDIEVALFQSGQKKLTFPNGTIKVITANKMILSDFEKGGLNWGRLKYSTVSNQYKALTNKSLPRKYETVSKALTKKQFLQNPVIMMKLQNNSVLIQPRVTTSGHSVSVSPSANTRLDINTERLRVNSANRLSFNTEISRSLSAQFSKDYAKIVLNKFKIAPGDYEIRVMHKERAKDLSSVQHVQFNNPPPPPPKPDIFPISIGWANGVPLKGEKAALSVLLGVSHGEQAKNSIDVTLSANPSISGLRDIRVNRTVLNDAPQTLMIKSRDFTLNRAGNVSFTASADATNKIVESNESNNIKKQSLRIRDYSFRAVVKTKSFTSLSDRDDNTFCGDEEYRIDLNVSATNGGERKVNFNKNGAKANVTYDFKTTTTYNGLREGDKVNLFTSGYEKGDCLEGDESMGSASKTYTIENKNNHSHEIQLRAKHYIIRGSLTYEKQVLN